MIDAVFGRVLAFLTRSAKGRARGLKKSLWYQSDSAAVSPPWPDNCEGVVLGDGFFSPRRERLAARPQSATAIVIGPQTRAIASRLMDRRGAPGGENV